MQKLICGKKSEAKLKIYVETALSFQIMIVLQARKLQATLVLVRNYHRPTDLLADGGEV